ncbi:type II toxin-antitoxin system VapC family toxin [Treponema primitia]|uniref:type II toxin-antitoxin system VapC family toxin n=1 Tax=Treponema primitia TaxID=88058 RepID=UPI0002554D1F|nr:type II toxin-antitoxin system VapC family toxin [Treponema primitia]
MNIVIDASVIMALIIDEPEKEIAIRLTKDTTLLAPQMIPFEIGNALTRIYKRHILVEDEIIKAYREFKKIPLKTVEVDMENALRIACKYTIYAYDAYYLETAKRLKIPLLTFDANMKRIALEMNLELLEDENENI